MAEVEEESENEKAEEVSIGPTKSKGEKNTVLKWSRSDRYRLWASPCIHVQRPTSTVRIMKATNTTISST